MNKRVMTMFGPLPPFILASGSPRRRQLLARVGLVFKVVASTMEEPPPERSESPEDYAVRMASLKARDVARRVHGPPILAADTVVAVGRRILGKPEDASHALAMLAALCGEDRATPAEREAGVRMHHVTTGCCLLLGKETRLFSETTTVAMNLTPRDVLERYVATKEPLDKAGAYAVQGAGGALVARLEGSYTNVIGLPLAEVCAALRSLQPGAAKG